MTSRDEVARRVAAKLGLDKRWGWTAQEWIDFVTGKDPEYCAPDYCEDLWDALISSEQRVEELQEALRRIGNDIGGPTMNYAPTIERKELLSRVESIASTVRAALSAKEKV